MNIQDASKNWTALGEDDPMWVVLTDPAKKGKRWNKEEFFATGQADIEAMFQCLKAVGLSPASGRALDFGCGVGRLTQALAARFDSVDGVDISASMLRHAETFNRFPGRVTYHLNVRSDLATFPSAQYDFICTLIALQHTPPPVPAWVFGRFSASAEAGRMRLFPNHPCAGLAATRAKLGRRLYPKMA